MNRAARKPSNPAMIAIKSAIDGSIGSPGQATRRSAGGAALPRIVILGAGFG